MESLKRCPSCRGEAELIQFPVLSDQLWQVNCCQCGMGTELNDDRFISVQQWNRRDREERFRSLVTLLGVLLPTMMLLMFFLGVFLGISMIGSEAP